MPKQATKSKAKPVAAVAPVTAVSAVPAADPAITVERAICAFYGRVNGINTAGDAERPSVPFKPARSAAPIRPDASTVRTSGMPTLRVAETLAALCIAHGIAPSVGAILPAGFALPAGFGHDAAPVRVEHGAGKRVHFTAARYDTTADAFTLSAVGASTARNHLKSRGFDPDKPSLPK